MPAGEAQRVPAFDGVRALACLMVVAYHAGVPGADGGWAGVDVFFVLSGYLITGLLVREHAATGTLALGRFWLRRAARLYPALLLTVVGVVAVAAAVGRSHLATLGNAVVALTYTTDFVVAVDARTVLLSHTWSLAVEEQFYLVWPLVVLLARGRPAVLRRVCWAGIALAVVVCCVSTEAFAYFGPVTRSAGLLAGALLALPSGPKGWPLALPPVVAGTLQGVLAGAAAMAVLAIAGAPAVGAGIVVCTAVGLLAVAGAARPGPFADLLSVAPLVWLGRRSYALYLVHAPLATGLLGLGWSWPVRLVVLLAVCLPVVAASYRWVELPVREWARRSTGQGRTLSSQAPSAPRRTWA